MNPRAMLNLSKLLQSRNQLFQRGLLREDVRDSVRLHGITSQASISTTTKKFSADGKFRDNIFADFCIYKGKAAVSAHPCLPTFIKLDSGALKVDRRGVIMLLFSPAIGERKYDWEKKQCFALSATEVGSLISLGPNDSCEFFHDPSMKSSNAGQVRKSLSIRPHADGSGYFISLSVVHNILKTNERFTVPVTTAEFAVMRTAFNFALPHIMGWDRYTNQLPMSVEENSSKQYTNQLPKSIEENSSKKLMDLEWDR